jgi:hypothetical protein
MGCFSWYTQDTNKPIYISGWGAPGHAQRTYYMWDNKGNFWTEPDYEGYGMFGSKDYYVLLAEMNNVYADGTSEDDKRNDGIAIYFSKSDDGILFPNLTESSIWTWKNKKPQYHANQGFYDPFDDEDYW